MIVEEQIALKTDGERGKVWFNVCLWPFYRPSYLLNKKNAEFLNFNKHTKNKLSSLKMPKWNKGVNSGSEQSQSCHLYLHKKTFHCNV